MSEYLEITTFRPAPGLSASEFVAANADVDQYLRRQPGFLWRRTMAREDGVVVDIAAYDTREHAESGASGIMSELGDSPVHATIDQSTVDWQITRVIHAIEAD